MKTLILLRHAKSSWDFPFDDIDRPLKLKGINSIIKTAIESAEMFNKSDIIMTSHANRAVHTAIILARETNLGVDKISINYSLYSFSSTMIEKTIRTISNKYDYITFVGHNPAFTDLINKLSNKKIKNLKTASWAKISFKENKWENIGIGKVSFKTN
ncbi:MAG: histidine phosphatase family protein [Flavobacteriales bacterium]|nr:histidine phosphatase family protein [Flavobacteriales bacterium]